MTSRKWLLLTAVIVVALVAYFGWRFFQPQALPDGFALKRLVHNLDERRFFRTQALPDGFSSSNGRIEAVEIDVATKTAGRLVAVISLCTFARTMPQFALLLMLVLLPLQMLSGGMTPRESMPEVVQHLMLAAPTTHFVMLAQGILYRGAGLQVIWPQFLALALIGAVLFGIALARFRKTTGTMA
jgi:hypothetical protein